MTCQAAPPASSTTRSPLNVPLCWTQSRLSRHVRINEGLVDPEMEPYSSMSLIAPNHIESGTGRILYTESSDEQGAESGKYLVRRGQVIYSKIRPNLMKVALAPADCLCSADMYGLEGRHGQIDNRYLKWFLLSREFTEQIVLESLRSALPKVNRDSLGASKIWFPSITEQVQLTRFLDRETAQIDDLIGKQERLIGLLAEKRQTIITHAVTKGLDSTAPTKPSGVAWQGCVPEHWTVQPLKNLMRMQTGVTLGKDFSEVETETYAYLRVANVQIGYVDLNDVKEIDLPSEVAASSMLQPGDVLMTEGGDRDKLARGCIWDGSISPCVHQNHIFAVRTGPQLLNSFLVLVLDADPARTYFYLTGKQSTNLASTNSTTVKNFRFGVPPISEQRRIVNHLKTKTLQIDDLVEKAKAVISTLKERRSALISAAVTGKIEVGSS